MIRPKQLTDIEIQVEEDASSPKHAKIYVGGADLINDEANAGQPARPGDTFVCDFSEADAQWSAWRATGILGRLHVVMAGEIADRRAEHRCGGNGQDVDGCRIGAMGFVPVDAGTGADEFVGFDTGMPPFIYLGIPRGETARWLQRVNDLLHLLDRQDREYGDRS